MNIYVGNLSYKVRENDLQGVIEEYGAVESCKIIKDRETGKSKGFAFVEMADDAAAAKVISFGDYSNYWIADRQGRAFQRLNELYAVNGQVGFL